MSRPGDIFVDNDNDNNDRTDYFTPYTCMRGNINHEVLRSMSLPPGSRFCVNAPSMDAIIMLPTGGGKEHIIIDSRIGA